jgi:hypothetical protein
MVMHLCTSNQLLLVVLVSPGDPAGDCTGHCRRQACPKTLHCVIVSVGGTASESATALLAASRGLSDSVAQSPCFVVAANRRLRAHTRHQTQANNEEANRLHVEHLTAVATRQ